MNLSAHSELIGTLADLVRINSVNPNYEGGVPEREIAEYVDRFFAERGIETWRQQVYPDRPNVIARIPGRNPKRRIVFEAHLDTVSTKGMEIAPWEAEVRDGRLYGRGACDTKGGMAAMMHAVASLARDGIVPECEILFAATIDEEYSFRGVVALCDSLAPGIVDPRVLVSESPPTEPWYAEAAIIAEPTSLAPVIASKGVVRWKIETIGKAAHSAKPHLGVSAIEHMAHILIALEQDTLQLTQNVHPLLGSATCNVGVIRGGVQVNFVPDRCEIEIDRRLLPNETRETVLQHYQQLIQCVSSAHAEMNAIMHAPMLSDRPLDTSPETPAAQVMARVLSSLGLDPTLRGVPFCSDASKFGAIGIPSIILGPGSIDQAHASVEYIECDQVIQAMQIYRKFMIEFE